MASQLRCPRCQSRKLWVLAGGRRRCARCRFDWRPGRLPLRLTPRQWRLLLQWFVRGVSSSAIAHETRIERKRVLRALTVVRLAMASCAPLALGPGAAANPSNGETRRGAVIGLYVQRGEAWAQVISEPLAGELRNVLRGRGPQPVELPAELPYAAVSYRGRFCRVTRSASREPPARFGELEAFWAYLRQQLRARGGIRSERLGLHLAEFSWRYTHRQLSPTEQFQRLYTLLRRAKAVDGVGLSRWRPSP